MSIDPNHNRKIASMLADTLAPLVAEHMVAAQPAMPPRKVLVKADRGVMTAAERVAVAYERLQQVKYTRAEVSARLSLERSASALRTEMRRRDRRHGK